MFHCSLLTGHRLHFTIKKQLISDSKKYWNPWKKSNYFLHVYYLTFFLYNSRSALRRHCDDCLLLVGKLERDEWPICALISRGMSTINHSTVKITYLIWNSISKNSFNSLLSWNEAISVWTLLPYNTAW